MAEHEDWLYRPILRGLCDAGWLYDAARDLGQFVEMNEALDVEAENHIRARRAATGG